jgi:hypothetical protein
MVSRATCPPEDARTDPRFRRAGYAWHMGTVPHWLRPSVTGLTSKTLVFHHLASASMKAANIDLEAGTHAPHHSGAPSIILAQSPL